MCIRDRLKALDLSSNYVRAQGARSLAAVMGQCHSLVKLDLGGNDIDSKALARLRACWLGPAHGLVVDDRRNAGT